MYKMNNIVINTDSYKVTHHNQYPPKTEKIVSYFESRGGKHADICFFGLQILIKKYLVGQVVTQEKIDQAYELFGSHLGNTEMFNKKGWEYILNHHGGKLPIKIKALPEGTVLPYKNACFTLENTDPNCFWLTNYLETLLVQVWYPMTVATNSREQKKVILKYLEETGDPSLIDFKLHDFGFRGVSSLETAGIGAAAHLTQFLGTDTVAGLMVAKEYYGKTDSCAGFSIPASEHSTITSWGKSGEVDAFKNMLDQNPTGLVACVSDSFDIFKACEHLWGEELKDQIMARDGTLIIRPDSGDPKTVNLKIMEILGEKFGFEVNAKGYKVLDPHVRVIQGDGICYETLIEILEYLKENRWSADNIAFGSGGGLLQKMDRDTQKCAFKCSLAIIDGQEVAVQKDPITDKGKKSKRGWLTVHNIDGVWETRSDGNHDFETDCLETVFLNGELLIDHHWDDIKKRSQII